MSPFIRKAKPNEILAEQLMYSGICPKCGKPIFLVLTQAEDGCWSEHFKCEFCGYLYPNQAMTRIGCAHEKEMRENGFISNGIKTISTKEHYETKPLKEK